MGDESLPTAGLHCVHEERLGRQTQSREETQVSDNPVFLYAGDYESVDDAKADLRALKELHGEHFVGTFDAAVITKDEKGKVKIVDKTEKPTQHGG